MTKRTRATWRIAAGALAAALAAPLSLHAACDWITAAAYPDADAVLVDGLEETSYAPDGTYETVSDNVVKVLTEKGRREERVIDLSYNARYGRAEVLGVSRVLDDGAEEPIDVSATLKEVADNASAAENIYDPMRRKLTCTIPGLAVGDTVRIRTRRRVTKSRIRDVFASCAVLEWTCPIVRQRVRVVAPPERPLASAEVRSPLGNVTYAAETRPDGSVVHLWTATNSPQAFEEPDMPPLHTQVQRVAFSTASDWREISRWYWEVCAPHLAKTTPAVTNRVEEILAALPPDASRHDALRAVFKWVSQEVRYMGLTMEDTAPGYAPHDVDVTFDNRYGVCRDKAALLAAMLRIAGFDAYPVLIHAGAKMDPGVPQPYFNHAITAVAAPGDPAADGSGYILMDATNESSRDLMPAYLSDTSYLVATPAGEGLHVSGTPPADRNAVAVETRGGIDSDGVLVLRCDASFTGLNDNLYRSALLRKKPDERRRLFESLVRGALPGAELLSLEIEPKDLRETEMPLSVRLFARAADCVVRGETRSEFPLPLMSRAIGSANWLLDGRTSLDRRRFPLVLTSTAKVTETLRLECGEMFGEPEYMPDAFSVEGPYSFSLSCSATNGVLSAERELSVDAVEFSPEEYDSLREDVKRVETAERRRPAFSPADDAGAHVRILRSRCDCEITGERSWTVRNRVDKEILTYQGKKKSAELKFSYNPAWKGVEVVRAAVSNRNGRVSSAGARETSVFDCGWAAAAPRYPASKQMIVNLPSVEIGSVISIETVTTVSNSPAPFNATWFFDSAEPADEIEVSFRSWPDGKTWRRTVRNPKRVPREPMQPDDELWRDVASVSLGDFHAAAESLKAATGVAPLKGPALEEAMSGTDASAPPAARLKALRDWMAKHVRVAGPSLYEVPLALQLTPPETVLRERYATRLDYVRTMCALARGAGLDADIVFASLDAADEERKRRRDMEEYPDIASFSHALCRVRVREGGFLWWGGRETTYYIGTESQYSPLGATRFAWSHALDPADGTFFVVAPSDPTLDDADSVRATVYVRENGAVDIDYERAARGPEAGEFRAKYAEMLPEERQRHFQTLLGALSQAASATRELETDVEGYPAVLRYSAYVPGYATVEGDVVTLPVPAIGAATFPLTGAVRRTPVELPFATPADIAVTVVFPKGYDVPEHLPEPYAFAAPDDGTSLHSLAVETSRDADGRLAVTLRRTRHAHGAKSLPRESAALLREFSRTSSSRANRTVSARRSGKGEAR